MIMSTIDLMEINHRENNSHCKQKNGQSCIYVDSGYMIKNHHVNGTAVLASVILDTIIQPNRI